jgi:hypothetical protein
MAASRRTVGTQSRRKQTVTIEGASVNAASNGKLSINLTERNGLRTAPSFDQIQRRAYEIFLARGATHGDDIADWLMAEQELSAVTATVDSRH